ncbi:MAG: hypothetical protein HFH68_04300 [Lachnospiraceae bacterium]|nr:hypothetical protein [Lachnospiraceae bacterium]
MFKKTQELLEILKGVAQPGDYIDKEEDNLVKMELHEYIRNILNSKGISSGLLIKNSGLDRTYTYQILSGAKKPSRDKVLAICFTLKLSFEEIQDLLKATGYPILYARISRDSIIIFALQHNITLTDTNELLFDFGYSLIQ